MFRKYLIGRFLKGTSLLVSFLLFSVVLLIYLLNTKATLNKVKIKNCYDGDTCTTESGEKIRLACIDASEIKGNMHNPNAAKKANAKKATKNGSASQTAFLRFLRPHMSKQSTLSRTHRKIRTFVAHLNALRAANVSAIRATIRATTKAEEI